MERFEIRWVANGDDAWQLLSSEMPDIFITDILHPGMSGQEILRGLSANKAPFPIVVSSGYEDLSGIIGECRNLKLSTVYKAVPITELIKHLEAIADNSDS